ncbi:HET-domain-containing protein [Daedaleopsis nitida]|nr:HET-domain-containing protein [Daedaleopsis nitida]
MWLLRTSTGELEYFNSPSDVKGGYAILSHVWQRREMSFQELWNLRLPVVSSQLDSNPRSRASPKIRECCKLAESHGYKWLWIDTCCIDRTSSSELSEAVNSMFAWYSQAHVCYAYLHDVPSVGSLTRGDSAFRRSKWFTRGWTLQELIAPRSLVFFSQDWQMLGTKASLSALLEQISGVDADVLTFRRHISDVSVARRMWWASSRQTTRIEDQAYSLMGLFGVHLPTIYGEGIRAFRRLQEEILKHTSDQTLFAWGHVLPIRSTPFRERLSHSNYHDDSHLFAPSPAAFHNSAHMVSLPVPVAFRHAVHALGIRPSQLDVSGKPTTQQGSYYKIHLPDFSITSHGARSRMLVIESSLGQSVLGVATLACRDESTGSCIGLLLRRSRFRVHQTGFKDPRYYVGVTMRGAENWAARRYRLAPVDWAPHILSFGNAPITAEWKRLYISHRPSSRQPQQWKASPSAFRFYCPAWLEVEMKKQGFESDAPLPLSCSRATQLEDGGSIVKFTFTHRSTGEAFRIQVGQCGGSAWASAASIATRPPAQEKQAVALNAYAHHWTIPLSRTPTFDCARNSLRSWPNGSKTFGDSKRRIQLTFTRADDGPIGTHLLDIRVGGRTYLRKHSPRSTPSRQMHTLSRTCALLRRLPM